MRRFFMVFARPDPLHELACRERIRRWLEFQRNVKVNMRFTNPIGKWRRLRLSMRVCMLPVRRILCLSTQRHRKSDRVCLFLFECA